MIPRKILAKDVLWVAIFPAVYIIEIVSFRKQIKQGIESSYQEYSTFINLDPIHSELISANYTYLLQF